MDYLINIGENAKKAAKFASLMSSDEKNKILHDISDELIDNESFILEQNLIDVKAAANDGIKSSFIDRLTLSQSRIISMANGLRTIASLNDPIGEVINMKTLPNGLMIGQKRVAMGVICIIYEARPNVTADAFGLVLKAGSSIILRGGKEAFNSNKAIVSIFHKVLEKNNMPTDLVQFITDTNRETALKLMALNKYIDVLIPRGSASLINSVVENATVPVIQTGVGNCHIFVDETADLQKAKDIIINAKTQRPGVCNACEKILIHEKISENFLPVICKELNIKNVLIKGDELSKKIVPTISSATEEDWSMEYEDLIIAIKVVNSIDNAIEHINTYSTSHSEAIITEDYSNSQKFLNEIDSAAVYVNASTRFTDGFEFGFGAEMGISTQKLHARGPMGLKELTTTKYIIYGNGQIRA